MFKMNKMQEIFAKTNTKQICIVFSCALGLGVIVWPHIWAIYAINKSEPSSNFFWNQINVQEKFVKTDKVQICIVVQQILQKKSEQSPNFCG